jgi:hypothetical protein
MVPSLALNLICIPSYRLPSRIKYTIIKPTRKIEEVNILISNNKTTYIYIYDKRINIIYYMWGGILQLFS